MDARHLVVLRVLEPKTRADRERLESGLARLTAEDPTFRVDRDHETGQTVIAGMGELPLEIIVDRLKREFGVEATVSEPRVAYKETITSAAEGEGRYIKQTGGHSQYGHVRIRLIPRKPGEGYEFENQIVGGTIPREFITSIQQGIREAMATGMLAGYPIDDVRIELYDGSYHDVDSSEAAFKIAGAMAFKDAAKKASPVLLEPIMRVEVTAPEECVPDLTADIASRRGQLQSMEARGGSQFVSERVPLSEMFGYASDLRARTQGRASFRMVFDGYRQFPDDRDGDDAQSRVSTPRTPAPRPNNSSVALPEPDDNGP